MSCILRGRSGCFTGAYVSSNIVVHSTLSRTFDSDIRFGDGRCCCGPGTGTGTGARFLKSSPVFSFDLRSLCKAIVR